MITQIDPNIKINYFELHNHVNSILAFTVKQSFINNTKLLPSDKRDEFNFHIAKLISLSLDLYRDGNLTISNNLINSFKQAH